MQFNDPMHYSTTLTGHEPMSSAIITNSHQRLYGVNAFWYDQDPALRPTLVFPSYGFSIDKGDNHDMSGPISDVIFGNHAHQTSTLPFNEDSHLTDVDWRIAGITEVYQQHESHPNTSFHHSISSEGSSSSSDTANTHHPKDLYLGLTDCPQRTASSRLPLDPLIPNDALVSPNINNNKVANYISSGQNLHNHQELFNPTHESSDAIQAKTLRWCPTTTVTDSSLSNIQKLTQEPSVRKRESEDSALIYLRQKERLTYKEIKNRMNYSGAVSTLRGRYRGLTTPKADRIRSPKWTETDVQILKEVVRQQVKTIGRTERRTVRSFEPKSPCTPAELERRLQRVRWADIAEAMRRGGASYKFAANACKQMFKRKYLVKIGDTDAER